MKPSLYDPWHLDEIPPDPVIRNLDRAGLVEFIEYSFSEFFPGHYQQEGACLYWSYIVCSCLRLAGLRAILQAGSFHWPVLPMTEPERPTHFGYEFDLSQPFSLEAVAAGKLAEVHVWAALPDAPDGPEIVDFSTRSLRFLAETRHGLAWETPEPPRFLWCKGADLPEGVIYAPSLAAIQYVFGFIESHGMKPKRAEVVYA